MSVLFTACCTASKRTNKSNNAGLSSSDTASALFFKLLMQVLTTVGWAATTHHNDVPFKFFSLFSPSRTVCEELSSEIFLIVLCVFQGVYLNRNGYNHNDWLALEWCPYVSHGKFICVMAFKHRQLEMLYIVYGKDTHGNNIWKPNERQKISHICSSFFYSFIWLSFHSATWVTGHSSSLSTCFYPLFISWPVWEIIRVSA